MPRFLSVALQAATTLNLYPECVHFLYDLPDLGDPVGTPWARLLFFSIDFGMYFGDHRVRLGSHVGTKCGRFGFTDTCLCALPAIFLEGEGWILGSL